MLFLFVEDKVWRNQTTTSLMTFIFSGCRPVGRFIHDGMSHRRDIRKGFECYQWGMNAALVQYSTLSIIVRDMVNVISHAELHWSGTSSSRGENKRGQLGQVGVQPLLFRGLKWSDRVKHVQSFYTRICIIQGIDYQCKLSLKNIIVQWNPDFLSLQGEQNMPF